MATPLHEKHIKLKIAKIDGKMHECSFSWEEKLVAPLIEAEGITDLLLLVTNVADS